jgi:glucosylceramidase
MRLATVVISVSVFYSQMGLSSRAQTVQVLETRGDGSVRLAHGQIEFSTRPQVARAFTISVDETIRFQKMDGFGASLTDSSAALLMQMPQAQREALMHRLFDPTGPLGITLLRQPIGASDFSAHGDYSYDDPPGGKPDPALAHFNTASDGKALFPLLREAMQIDPHLRLMALPWSAPAWMKDSHSMHAGSLEKQYVPVYAVYLSDAVKAWAAEGLPVFAMALQNEPLNENASYPTQRMEPGQEAQLAAALRPLLWKQGLNPLLLGYEHNWDNLAYPAKLLADAAELTPKGSLPLFAGISFHCYAGNESAQLSLLKAHAETGVWFTECSGVNGSHFGDDLMWQSKHLLLGAPLNGARSVLLWNLLLDPHGGPHNGGCSDCRALITLDSHGGQWVAQTNVEYDVLAHAGPYIHPGAVRIAAMPGSARGLESVAFQNTDGTYAMLVLNENPRETKIELRWQGKSALYLAPARSLLTFAWGTPQPAIQEGTYRIAAEPEGTLCLEATAGVAHMQLRPAAAAGADFARQLWTLHPLEDGRFEVRNVAYGQSLALDAHGSLVALSLDGNLVAPLVLRLQPEGLCIAATTTSACAAVNRQGDVESGLHAGDIVHLLPPLAANFSDK